MQGKKVRTTIMRVGITVPGWPMSAYPSGIVTYAHNIAYGFHDKAKLIIFAAPLIGTEVKDQLINLSRFIKTKNVFEKIVDKVIYQSTSVRVRSLQYRQLAKYNAQKINLALQTLTKPLDILEIEESFGTGNFVLKLTKVPIVTRLHGPWFLIGPIMQAQDQWDFKLRVFLEGEAIRKSSGLTSPSLDVLNKVRSYYGLELPNAQVIPNPVLEVGIEMQWQYTKKIKPTILFVGRFDSVKGGDVVLDAFNIIAKKNSEIELLFVGPDKGVAFEGGDINFNAYVERSIQADDIKSRIQFLGHCDQIRISDLRKNSLVTIVCSRYETFSIALVEALAAGCPTVATAVGGMKEIIIDDFNGLLADPESPESIAEKVLELIIDPERMQRLSKNAIEDCKKRFSPEVVAAQTIEYYESVIDRVSNPSAKINR